MEARRLAGRAARAPGRAVPGAVLGIALAAALPLAGCHGLRAGTAPDGAFVLPERMAAGPLLRPCARHPAAAVEGAWTPDADMVAGLERRLGAALAHAAARTDFGVQRPPAGLERAPVDWVRQYGGVIRGGRKLIVGNYVRRAQARTVSDLISDRHPEHDPAQYLAREPIFVCDGGAENFGVEYDPASGRFPRIEFDARGRRHLSDYSYDLRS